MAWIHVGTECDGRWVKEFPTFEAAHASLAARAMGVPTLGETPACAYTGRLTFCSDIGGRHFVRELPEGMHARTYEALGKAYDAREMGTLTERQERLLARWHW